MIKLDKYLLKVDNPAQYLGNELNSIHKKEYKTHMAIVYPDLYEVGMSSLAIRILYGAVNSVDGVYMERAFSPKVDMEEFLRKDGVPLFSIETKTPLKKFDAIGFSLAYEMTYTNFLNILDLSEIPFERKERGEEYPIIIAGGTGAYNPKVLEKFVDVFMIGEGEESIKEVAEILRDNSDKSKLEKLQFLSKIEGVYVPEIYNGQKIKKRIVKDLNKIEVKETNIVPYTSIVHNRLAYEVQRGCTRGFRFCQAGVIYRPVRERSIESVKEKVTCGIMESGYNEVSLASLSSSDYSVIDEVIDKILSDHKEENLSISLPSLRIEKHSVDTALKVESGRKTGFTFAPEAGSQRMRDVINKGVTEEDIMETAKAAFEQGWKHVKFYFMIGLPFETLEDVAEIYNLAKKVLDMGRRIDKGINITVSVSNFVPKLNTPFQWEKQMGYSEMEEKHGYLRELFRQERRLTLKIHEREISYLEGIISRGDERIADVIKRAWELGAKFDGWREHFRFDLWKKAMLDCGIDEEYYMGARDLDAKLPWDFIDCGVSKEYMMEERENAIKEVLTRDCRNGCTNCGACPSLDAKMVIIKK